MRDPEIFAEVVLIVTWLVSTLVFVLLVLRLIVHRRAGLNTPAIIASDTLVTLSWICSTLAVSLDTWEESRMIQSHTGTLTPDEMLISWIVCSSCLRPVFKRADSNSS